MNSPAFEMINYTHNNELSKYYIVAKFIKLSKMCFTNLECHIPRTTSFLRFMKTCYSNNLHLFKVYNLKNFDIWDRTETIATMKLMNISIAPKISSCLLVNSSFLCPHPHLPASAVNYPSASWHYKLLCIF